MQNIAGGQDTSHGRSSTRASPLHLFVVKRQAREQGKPTPERLSRQEYRHLGRGQHETGRGRGHVSNGLLDFPIFHRAIRVLFIFSVAFFIRTLTVICDTSIIYQKDDTLIFYRLGRRERSSNRPLDITTSARCSGYDAGSKVPSLNDYRKLQVYGEVDGVSV